MQERDEDPVPGVPPRGDADPPGDAELAALLDAMARKPELPQPPAGFDDRRLGPLGEAWRLLPGESEKDIDLGTGWRRRLRDIAWRLLRPILHRQQQFNMLLVQHLGSNVQAANESRESAAGVIATLDHHLGALAAFQAQLIHYLGRSAAGQRAVQQTTQHTTDGLRQSIVALERTTEGLRQSVDLATASTHGLKREIKHLRRPPAAPPGQPGAGHAASPGTAETDLDAYQYICFEDVFRGSREEIAARQREYLQYFEGASDVLDVGCGRGEFLALLRDEGITARGVDANAEAVERCRERGLEVARSDVLAYLRTLADESIGGLFSAQVVEHLDADYLMQVLGDAQRVLRPGSRILLETINPASWTAFFSAFVRDVTHRHPLHPDTLGYLLRASGFVDVTIEYRAPMPDAAKLQHAAVDPALASAPGGAAFCKLAETLNQHADRLNGLIFAEQDYAAIARRP